RQRTAGTVSSYWINSETPLATMEVEYIGAENFRGRVDIVRGRVAPNVTEIGDGAFFECENLREADLGDVAKINVRAFRQCFSLVNIFLPPTVTEIGDQAFFGCRALGGALRGNPNNWTIYAFGACSSLEHINFPLTVTEIGRCAFASCNALRAVALSVGLLKIGRRAFKHCRSLEFVTVRSNFVDIDAFSFSSCISLRVVDLCEGTHHIGSDAFEGCTSLLCVNVPPNSYLIEWVPVTSYRLLRYTTIPPYGEGLDGTVVSGKLGGSSLQLLAKVEQKISKIIGRQHQTVEEKVQLLHDSIEKLTWRRGTPNPLSLLECCHS
ncbi:LOW QUALITY PROTEIN: hypothetical protein ACHAWF_006437, partial [Thalassiosira exigua]